jgi:lipid-binding SYLF domain-containing protein
MARAHGIAVIPHVAKGAFGVGGQWGKGVMSQRREDGSWSAPAYVEIGGG